MYHQAGLHPGLIGPSDQCQCLWLSLMRPPFLGKGNARSLGWHLEDNVAAAEEVTNEPSREQFRTSYMESYLKKKRKKLISFKINKLTLSN